MRPIFILLAAAALAGCTATSGTPNPTASQAAPQVANPKDARDVPPCTLISAPQASALGVDLTRAKPGSTADLVDCNWRSTEPEVSSVAVTVDTNPARRGLSDTYLKRVEFKIFEPLVIDGYPAVRAERVPSGGCSIEVGLSEIQGMRIDVFALNHVDACGLAKRVGAAVLANLPPQK